MNNRRRFIRQSSLVATALLASQPLKTFAGISSSSLFSGLTGEKHLTILHSNDICNQLSPVADHSFYHGIGGLRNMTELIASIRNNSSSVLLLDAGNSFSGNIRHRDQHIETLQLMQQAGYDAMLPGYAELQAGTSFFTDQFEQQDTPLIASNYSLSDEHLSEKIKPYKIIQKGNIKVGIIGAGAKVSVSTISYKNPLKQLDALATQLKKEKQCDLVICLSNLGFEHNKAVDDIQLAKQSTAIDIIIGGGSRHFMEQPAIIRNRNKNEVIVNHAGHSGIVLGRIDIGFSRSGIKNSIRFDNRMVGYQDKRWKSKA